MTRPDELRPCIRDRAAAFSLIELIVVIAVVAVLIGILVPVLAMGKRSAQQISCLANLRDMSTALRSYMTQENRDLLPLLNGYSDQSAEPGEFTAVIPLLARLLDIQEPVLLDERRYKPQAPFVCPHDDDIGPAWGLSYDYFPGGLMIDYVVTGDLDPTLAGPVTRLYEGGDYTVLFADIKPWHDHPIDGRMAAFWDGSAGPIKGN